MTLRDDQIRDLRKREHETQLTIASMSYEERAELDDALDGKDPDSVNRDHLWDVLLRLGAIA